MKWLDYSFYGPKVLVTIPCRTLDELDDDRVAELGEVLRYLLERGPNTNIWFSFPTEKGYGNAIRHDWEERKDDVHFGEKGYDMYLLWDNDFATPVEEVPRFVDAILWKGYDVVVGARTGRLDNPRQMVRGIMSRSMNKMLSLVFRMKMKEFFSGFRAYSRRFVEEALEECSEPHWMFQPESSIVAANLGLNVTEIPIPYDNTIRPTKLSRLPKDLMDIIPGFRRLIREWA